MSRSATPATRNEATTRLKPPKMTTSAELPIGTAIRSSYERLRTVANGCGRGRNVERTHPQPPDPQSETGTLATHSGKNRTPKYPMALTQVPKHMALTAFVMLSFQCLVASSLAQSMPHSCSFRDPWPMCFPFSNSGYMPATKIKSLHSMVKISDSFAVKICSIWRSQFQRQMWDQAQNH